MTLEEFNVLLGLKQWHQVVHYTMQHHEEPLQNDIFCADLDVKP